MKNPVPIVCDRCRQQGWRGEAPFAHTPSLDFTPVPRKHRRRDGWTEQRQRAFIHALAAGGSVTAAAKAVNMTPESAHMLRRAPGAESFNQAWDLAIDFCAEVIEGAALERAIHGVAVPHYHAGEKVGERRVHNERLTMWLLQHRRPERYGHASKGRHNGEELDRAEAIRARDLGNHEAWLEKLSKLYGHRIREERKARLAGDVVAADFYLRQLTHMEVLIELGGGGKYLLWWANGGNGSGTDPHNMGVEIAGTEITEMLDAHRRKNWAQAGEPDRPKGLGHRQTIDVAMMGGPDAKERQALLIDAKARAAQAQLMWEEAVRDQIRARGFTLEEVGNSNSSPSSLGEGDHQGGGGGEERSMSGGHASTAGRSADSSEEPTEQAPISPRTGKPLKRYKLRRPKPPFEGEETPATGDEP